MLSVCIGGAADKFDGLLLRALFMIIWYRVLT